MLLVGCIMTISISIACVVVVFKITRLYLHYKEKAAEPDINENFGVSYANIVHSSVRQVRSLLVASIVMLAVSLASMLICLYFTL